MIDTNNLNSSYGKCQMRVIDKTQKKADGIKPVVSNTTTVDRTIKIGKAIENI